MKWVKHDEVIDGDPYTLDPTPCNEVGQARGGEGWGRARRPLDDFLHASIDFPSRPPRAKITQITHTSNPRTQPHLILVTRTQSRLSDLPLLLSYVRLPMLEPAVLERTQKNVLVAGVFRNSSNNRRLLEEAKAFHADMQAHHPSHTLEEYMESSSAMRQRPPRVGKALFALGGRYERVRQPLGRGSANRQMTPRRPPPAHILPP
jgi:hypothetical protein